MNKVWLLLSDLNGVLRGKLVPVSHRRLAELETEFSGVFINDIFDRPVPDLKRAEEKVNVTAAPQSEGIPSPWDKTEVYFMCNAYTDSNRELESKLCPRTLLTKAIKDAEKLGLRIKCGMELEWTLLAGSSSQNGTQEPVLGSLQSYSMIHYENSRLQSFFSELIDKTKDFPVTIEALHAESGKSIFEAALSPADPLKVADSTQLFRMTIRRLAKDFSMHATFMPKPYPESAGCGAHIHISLNNLDGSRAKDVLFGPFLSGLLVNMSSSLVLLCPNANSYKRVGGGDFWTCKNVSYGDDDRSEAIRMVQAEDTKGAARLEIRVAGGDVNPYLALMYCVRAGMWGVEKDLKLSDVGEPSTPLCPLPKTLREASTLFMSKDSNARLLYGDAFVDHYGQQRMHEATISETMPRPYGWERGVF